MAKKRRAPDPDELVKVWPHPELARRGEYLAGVGVDGAMVPRRLAEEWATAGLAVRRRPAGEG